MMTLYTTIGRYRVTEKGMPVILAGGKECALDTYELLLWSSLAFRILTYDELKAEFYEKEREMHLLSELDFDHYLNRLVMRRLIASGRDCTGEDALYDLLGLLYIQSVPSSPVVTILTFLKLCLLNGLPFRQATKVFHREKLKPMEKQIMLLIKDQLLSTAELIRCKEKGRNRLRSNHELMACLYDDEQIDCENILIESRFAKVRLPVLVVIANLYLKQQIIFDIL